jgi:hypothetical protein
MAVEQHWRVNYTYLKCCPYISPHSIHLQRHELTAAAPAAAAAIADAAVVTAATS